MKLPTLAMDQSIRFVTPLERLLYLRTLPQFGHLSVEEIANFAERARERYYRRGAKLAEEGAPLRSVHLLIEGKVTVRRKGVVILTVEPPYGAGFMAAMSGDSDGTELRAEEPTTTLEIDVAVLRDIMEDNFRVLRASLKQLTRQMVECQQRLERAGKMTRDEPVETEYPDHAIDLVERLVVLRGRGPFRNVSLDALSELARSQEEIRIAAGEVLFHEGDPATFGLHVLHGVVRCREENGRDFRMGPGSSIGHLESLADLPRSYTARAESRVVALKDDTEIFLDVLEDNFSAGWDFIAFFSSSLLALYERIAELEREGSFATDTQSQ